MNTPCNPCSDATGQGNALAAPRRNRYFYGKLLDVPHMQMEQDYGKLKRWMMNRLSVGTGVLCGLDVTVKDGKICVAGGVAIDSFGREIIVPATYCIDPWKLPDECGNPVKELDRNARHLIQLRVCYRECLSDNSPVQVSDCNSACACEAGTTIESFQFQIVEGAPERPTTDVCDLMHLDAKELAEITDIPAFIRQRLCAQLPHPCLGDKDCCVLLAVIVLLPDGVIGEVRSCAVRTVLYSNAMLFEMILCLVGRIEACCGGEPHTTPPPTKQPPTTPPPTTPPPTKEPPPTPPPTKEPPPTHPPKSTLRVKGVSILDRSGNSIVDLPTPDSVPSVSVNKQPSSIVVIFTEEIVKTSVVTHDYSGVFDPKSFSFLVTSDSKRFTRAYVPGAMQFPATNAAQFDLQGKQIDMLAFPTGTYTVTLFGDPDPTPAIKRPAISSPPPSAVHLDGDPNGSPPSFPSGDGTQGGQFVCNFVVK